MERVLGAALALLIGLAAACAGGASAAVPDRVLGLEPICGDCTPEVFTRQCQGDLEGPAFDRQGNLWVVAVVSGEIYRVAPDGSCTTVAHAPAPDGLRFHRDGTLYGVDRQAGIFTLDPATARLTFLTDKYGGSFGVSFHGLDDLFFDHEGGLYVTDAFGSSALRPNGQLFYRRPDGTMVRVIGENLAFPNGVVLSPDERTLYVDDWGTNRILAMPVTGPGQVDIDGAYVFAYLNGGHGPDSMTADAQGNIYAAHFGAGEVVVFDPNGFYYGAIRLPAGEGLWTTNVAFHDGRLYITEMQKHTIWRVRTKIPGLRLFGD